MAVSFIETDKNNENGLEALKFHPKLNLVQDAFKEISLGYCFSHLHFFSENGRHIFIVQFIATNSCSVFTSKVYL